MSLGVGRVGGCDGCGADDGNNHHGKVDEEHGAPPKMFQEESADDRPGGGAQGGGGAPNPDGGVAFLHVGEGGAQQRQGGGHHGGGANAEEGSGGDEDFGVGGEGGHECGNAENTEADFEHAAMTDLIPQGSGAEQEAGQDQGIHVDDPQCFQAGGVQAGFQCWERGVQDGVIDADHKEAKGDNPKEDPSGGIFVGGGHIHEP